MKFLYIDAGNDPDWATLAKHDIDGCFFDVRDPRLSAAYLGGVKLHKMAVGVYVVDSWPEIKNLTGPQCAEWMEAKLLSLFQSFSFPKVQFDLERHDPIWIAQCLTRWRELRPKQDTSWTFEGGQAGWMGPVVKPPAQPSSFVQGITSLRVRLCPQLYSGSMAPPPWDSLAYTRELTAIGFPDALISPFYDAAHLPHGWSGFAFSMGRLP
jgi:hypothetical protein